MVIRLRWSAALPPVTRSLCVALNAFAPVRISCPWVPVAPPVPQVAGPPVRVVPRLRVDRRLKMLMPMLMQRKGVNS